MFEGKTFLPVTGMPIRKIVCMMRLFALAEPVPLTVPILNAKSLTREEPFRPGAAGTESVAVLTRSPSGATDQTYGCGRRRAGDGARGARRLRREDERWSFCICMRPLPLILGIIAGPAPAPTLPRLPSGPSGGILALPNRFRRSPRPRASVLALP